MAKKQVAKAAIRLAKKSFAKTPAGKKAAKRKSLKDRADSRAAEVKAELAERRAVKKAASDEAFSGKPARRKRPGSPIGQRKNRVLKLTNDPDITREKRKQAFLAKEAAGSSKTSRKPLPPISKPKSGTTKNHFGQTILSPKDKALQEATKKKAATRRAAAKRTRKRAAGTAATAGAATAANKRRREKTFTDPRARSRGR